MSLTDHDTMAGVPAAAAEARKIGLGFVAGIEITAVHGGRDVHILAYDLSPDAPGLAELLATQRELRVTRAVEIARRLAAAGAPIDVDALVDTARRMSGKSIARPQIAESLVAAGHVTSVAEAFDRYLGEGCTAYVPHTGASPLDVVRLVRGGGGIASLAHPGVTRRDDLIPQLVEAGLRCLEVFHSAHDSVEQARYLEIARTYDLVPTGGSDFHGVGTRRSEFFGHVGLPVEYFQKLCALTTSGNVAIEPPV
jgi:predicted metal-dependent phosphoesterase TrpH